MITSFWIYILRTILRTHHHEILPYHNPTYEELLVALQFAFDVDATRISYDDELFLWCIR